MYANFRAAKRIMAEKIVFLKKRKKVYYHRQEGSVVWQYLHVQHVYQQVSQQVAWHDVLSHVCPWPWQVLHVYGHVSKQVHSQVSSHVSGMHDSQYVDPGDVLRGFTSLQHPAAAQFTTYPDSAV